MSAMLSTRRVAVSGARLRSELLFRSMLRVSNTRTQDTWTFCDASNEADVVLCGNGTPNEAVPRKSGAKQILVDLSDLDTRVSGEKLRLNEPIRITDVIALLDAASSRLAQRARPQAEPQPARAENGSFAFALALRDLFANGSPDVHGIEANDQVLYVIPASRSFFTTESADDEETVSRFLLSAQAAKTAQLKRHQIRELEQSGALPKPINALLWRAGHEGSQGRLLPGLGESDRFHLKRWPDFGKLSHTPGELRLTPYLVRAPRTLDELETIGKISRAEVCAYINACALLDLIEVKAPVSQVGSVIAKTEPVVVKEKRKVFSGVLGSIRAILGI